MSLAKNKEGSVNWEDLTRVIETIEDVLNDEANGDQHFDSDIYVDKDVISQGGSFKISSTTVATDEHIHPFIFAAASNQNSNSAAATERKVWIENEVYNNASDHFSIGVGKGILIAKPGYYYVDATVQVTPISTSNTYVTLIIKKDTTTLLQNRTRMPGGLTTSCYVSCSGIVRTTGANEYLYMYYIAQNISNYTVGQNSTRQSVMRLDF
jgi:hypothetical protein